MVKVIDSFDGSIYGFLSNFYDCEVMYEGLMYHNSEAAFQSAKIKLDTEEATISARKPFTAMAAGASKRAGRRVEIRPDWETVKNNVMYEVLKDKFNRNSELKEKLLNTGEAILIEGNTWHDNYWGDCKCEKCKDIRGKNTLGILLMRVRKEIRNTV